MIKMFLLHCLLLLLTIGSIFAQGGRKLVFTNFNFTIDPKYSNLTMWLNDSRLSVIAVAGPPTIGLTMDIKLYVKTTGTEEFKHFFTKHQDVCEMLNQSKFDPFIFLIAMAMASKKSNQILGTCPIASGTYVFKDFTLTEEQLPPMVPTLDFYVSIQMHHLAPQRKRLMNMRLDGRIDKVLKKPVNKSRRRNRP